MSDSDPVSFSRGSYPDPGQLHPILQGSGTSTMKGCYTVFYRNMKPSPTRYWASFFTATIASELFIKHMSFFVMYNKCAFKHQTKENLWNPFGTFARTNSIWGPRKLKFSHLATLLLVTFCHHFLCLPR